MTTVTQQTNFFQAAKVLDAYWDGKLPVDVDAIAEKMKIGIRTEQLLAYKVAQETVENRLYQHMVLAVLGKRSDTNEYTIELSPAMTPENRRFMLAHLIGFICFRWFDGKDPFVEFLYKDISIHNYEKTRLNTFASELLMPGYEVMKMILKERITNTGKLGEMFGVGRDVVNWRIGNYLRNDR